MVRRPRVALVPELFLGLLAISVAVVLTAHIVAGTIHDVRHSQDTLSVTGSARVPVTSNLVKWSLEVSGRGPRAAPVARRLRGEVATVRAFLRKAGIPADAISLSVETNETVVVPLPKHRQRALRSVAQQLEV